MSKKAKRVRKGPIATGPDAKGKVHEPQLPPEVVPVTAVPVSPSSAWLDMVSKSPETIQRREAGHGLDLLPLAPPPQPEWRVVDGECTGCLEKIATPNDHPWWCPWWDTTAAKGVVPF